MRPSELNYHKKLRELNKKCTGTEDDPTNIYDMPMGATYRKERGELREVLCSATKEVDDKIKSLVYSEALRLFDK